MKSKIIRSILAVAAVALPACAPGLGKTLRVDRFPELQSRLEAINPDSLVAVRVTECEDARGVSEVGSINGRKLEPESSVSDALCNFLRDSLRAEGLRVTQFEGAALRGVIKEWRVRVQPAFPSTKIEATASLQLFAGGPDGHDRYSANYRGEYATTHPFASTELIESNLAQALSEAVQSAMKDDRLRQALAMDAGDPAIGQRY